jgi:2-phosphoglycerate kinase
MNAVPFDTLKFARKLEASGMAAGVAAGTAEALAEAMTGAELATKSDIAALRAELKGDTAALRTELKADLELLRRDLIITLGSISVVGVGILLAAMRYMPVHP